MDIITRIIVARNEWRERHYGREPRKVRLTEAQLAELNVELNLRMLEHAIVKQSTTALPGVPPVDRPAELRVEYGFEVLGMEIVR